MFCQLFGYSKQAYYKSLSSKRVRDYNSLQIKHAVLEVRAQMPRLGTRKLKFILNKTGTVIGRDKLFDLLREEGLLITKRKKWLQISPIWTRVASIAICT